MFGKFESLIIRPFGVGVANALTAGEIIETLSVDLTAIDINMISKNFYILDAIEKEDEFFFELAVLCRDKTYSHPEWGLLSGRIKMLQIKRAVPKSFSESCALLKPVLGKNYYDFCMLHKNSLNSIVDTDKDWIFDIFASETLARGYLSRVKDEKSVIHLAETPQYLYLRISVFLWYPETDINTLTDETLQKIKVCYQDLSTGRISPPSPLQFNAGMKKPQLASCFLLSVEDSMESLSKNWHDSAIISMNNGGIGTCLDSVRHSEIGNHGWSQGVTPWVKIINEILSTVNQSGKRKGSGAMYLTDWHIDIFEFVDLKNPIGKEELRARDLFYGIMVSDLFMERVASDGMWCLFCPAKTDGLEKTYGKIFEKRYALLEERGLKGDFPHTFKHVRARDLWLHIIRSQITTGMPYIIYKDAVNRKSNQKHLGTLRLSNLCTEIMEYVDKDNIASCNLSSIPVSAFVKDDSTGKKYFDFEELGEVTRRAVRNLGQVINRNYYPEDIPQIKFANLRNRPVGIGIQDLAGCFALLDLCWDSLEAKQLNEKIARVMYYHGMDENVAMAVEYGKHESFPGSPASQGLFQFDLWALEKANKKADHDNSVDFLFLEPPCKEFHWSNLRMRMMMHGLYFCMLFSQMPTASSAHIRGNNESIEPYTQLLFARTVLSGQFVICVPHLVRDLEAIGMWNKDILKHLFANQGSIQTFPTEDLEESVRNRMEYLKKKYRTAFELSHRNTTASLYLDRAIYQCQSSSNNLFMKKPTATSVSAYHFYMWRGGAKTGMYYLRQSAGSDPLNLSIDSLQTTSRKSKNINNEQECTIDCLSCHS